MRGKELDRKTFDMLAESYVNEGKYSDGHICARILHYRLQDPAIEKRWWARLTSSNAVILKRIFKNSLLSNAIFQVILQIPGMRQGFKLSTWNVITTTRCDEVPDRNLIFLIQ
jgi:hypothetical protein